jgi:hypothetical protein
LTIQHPISAAYVEDNMHLPCVVFAAALATFGQADPPPAKLTQFPSPMVEHTRTHPRLKEERPPGKRIALKIGTLFLPESLPAGDAPLFLVFHCGNWLPEVAGTKVSAAALSIQLGSGSAAYGKPFADPKAFAELLAEAETKAERKFDRVGLAGWSAGYGAVRAILKTPEHYERVQFVLLLDGLHAGYKSGKPGPKESELVADDLAVFAQFAKDAVAGRKQFVLTHTEIFPGTYASTTETADWLLGQMKLKRTPVLRWGPMGTQILSETKEGRFHLLGFAGNSAPDHVDVLHSLPELLREIEWKTAK